MLDAKLYRGANIHDMTIITRKLQYNFDDNISKLDARYDKQHKDEPLAM